MLRQLVFGGACLSVMVAEVLASDLPKWSVLPQGAALQAVQAAQTQCEKDGYAISVAVVDRSGVLLAQLRDYRAGAHTVDSSRRKAYTAASLRESTQALATLVAKTPQIQSLQQMNEHILLLGGGLPIVFDGETVGGIGVGGAPGAHLDEKCAKAGLQAIGAALHDK